MKEVITPQDYFSDAPPQRIIGSECEYNVQMPPKVDITFIGQYINAYAIESAGYEHFGSFLSNGGRLYPDVKHLEYATPECLGPRQAAAADLAGITVMKDVVSASGNRHGGLFRIAGLNTGSSSSWVPADGHTSGYHENYMTPRSVAQDMQIAETLPTFLASRVWAMGGAVQRYGYGLSQKINGIGGKLVDDNMDRRVNNPDKPMVLIPSATDDEDVFNNPQWARIEVRYADPLLSPVARYVGFAATSLVLRLIEHSHKLPAKALNAITLRDPLEAARAFARDTSFTATEWTVYDKSVSVINIGESYIDLIDTLSEIVELPKDELDAIPLWADFLDRMRASSFDRQDYFGLEFLLDIAAKHRYIKKITDDLSRDNSNAVARSLLWDRIDPVGAGMKWWINYKNDIIDPTEIAKLVTIPPPTRARRRAKRIKRRSKSLANINWATTTDNADYVQAISDAYGTPVPTHRPVGEN